MARLGNGRRASARQRMEMEKWMEWWKRDRRYLTWLRALLAACLPIVSCLLYCALQGKGMGEVYLPSSERNDELFYYKQVEAIIQYGYPQGYFGFNESHALRLSFASWSPVLVLPWVLWGWLFGWNLFSPVVCNLVMMTLAMFLFVLLAKPDWRQLGVLALLFFLYVPFAWYMLCGMPEIICISMLLVFYGLAVAYLRRERAWMLALMFALAGILTLMRPYLLLFLFLPAYFWIFHGGAAGDGKRPDSQRAEKGIGKRRWIALRWKGILGSVAVIGAVLGCYACINHYLAAEYFEPLFYMDWLTAFFQRGFLGGLRNLFGSLYYSGREFWGYMRQGMVSGLAAGAIFCCYIAMLAVLLYQSLRDFLALRRDKEKGTYGRLVLEAHLAFAFLGMLMAQLLMYNFYDGCKHLLTFLAVGIFVVSLMRTAFFKKAALLGVLFAYFFTYHGEGFRDYQASFARVEVVAGMEEWEEALSRELALTGEERPNYDNVVIWVFSDRLPEGVATTGWQYLYALPAGFGISCCTSDYVLEDFDDLRSRYLCVVPGGPVEERCRQAGYEKIIGNESAVLYRRF